MNSIKWDEMDLLDFFETIPICIGDCGTGEYIYSQKQHENQWSISLFLSVYESRISVSIAYCNHVIASMQFNDVQEIKKRDDFIIFDVLPNIEVCIGKAPFYNIQEIIR